VVIDAGGGKGEWHEFASLQPPGAPLPTLPRIGGATTEQGGGKRR